MRSNASAGRDGEMFVEHGLAVESTGSAHGEGVRTDARGAFLIAAAPAGQIAVSCDGLWSNSPTGYGSSRCNPRSGST